MNRDFSHWIELQRASDANKRAKAIFPWLLSITLLLALVDSMLWILTL